MINRGLTMMVQLPTRVERFEVLSDDSVIAFTEDNTLLRWRPGATQWEPLPTPTVPDEQEAVELVCDVCKATSGLLRAHANAPRSNPDGWSLARGGDVALCRACVSVTTGRLSGGDVYVRTSDAIGVYRVEAVGAGTVFLTRVALSDDEVRAVTLGGAQERAALGTAKRSLTPAEAHAMLTVVEAPAEEFTRHDLVRV